MLKCGDKCINVCHPGKCDCGNVKNVKCVCGSLEMEKKCFDFEILKCDKVCNQKYTCKNHRCQTKCCPGRDKQHSQNF